METPKEANIFHVNLTEKDVKILYDAIDKYKANEESVEHLHHLKRIFFAMMMESNYHAADSV